jgi:hemolysin III
MLPRALTRNEYLADLAVHIAGIAASIAGAAILIVIASLEGRATPIVTASIYCFGLLLMWTASLFYNAIRPVKRTSWLRRFDHAAIFIMIAGSCTPFALQGPPGWRVFYVVVLWTLAFAGAFLKLILPGRLEKLMIWLYLGLGWGGAAILAAQIGDLPLGPAILLALGGVLYSVGVIFHVWDSLKFSNAVWHMFVLAAAVCHYGAIMGGVVLNHV